MSATAHQDAAIPASPWKVLRPAEPGREYLVLLSFLPLRRFRDFPAFVRHDARIARQLQDARGLLGYSKLGRPWVKRFWTLSAWEDKPVGIRSSRGNTRRETPGK